MTKPLAPETIAAQAGGHIDGPTGAVVPPIHFATTFERDPDNQYRKGYVYARPDNPLTRNVEEVLCALEGGERALLLGSGMSAATCAFLALERPAHVVAPEVMYWGLKKWLAEDAPSLGIRATFVDATSLAAIERAIVPGETRLIWIETPANPTWGVTDIRAAADLAHRAGALLAVDSTVATPVLTRPVALGADLVMHSATKYLNGHSDVLAGALVFAKAGACADRAARLRAMLGTVIGPMEASLLLRGMRTLPLRVRHQSASALEIAGHFASHPRIEAVLYPGLPDDPGHAVAASQMSGGFSGMLSVRVKGGEPAAIRAAANVKLWKRATSLGGVESLVEHRASVEGPGTPCPADLLRLSVGLEAPADLIADLEQALIANA
ncbi:MAG: PLP-dependent aspartate aminotransferase family protein [Hyphomicrobiaceae bacterium]